MPDIDIRPRPIAETLMPLAPSVRISIGWSLRGPIIGRPPQTRAGVSKPTEVFAMLPFAQFYGVAGDIGRLQAAVVVNERFAAARAQHLVFAQRLQRFAERARQKFGFRLVGRVGRRRRTRARGDSVEA